MTTAQITAGVSFKPEHFDAACACRVPGLWFEIHAENYLQDGGPRMAMLDALCGEHPVSVHGVGLSLASSERPDRMHLQRLKSVVERTQAVRVSEHLAWSMWQGQYLPDLLPFPRTQESLALVARNVDLVQSALRRPILIENPSLYVALDHALSEPEFLSELVARTGCGLLVDVNNVFVSAHNLGFDARHYLQQLPRAAIGEIHLAGFAADSAVDSPLLIDTHGAPIAAPVWQLYEELIARVGPQPTLIERDANVPAFEGLLAERDQAAQVLARYTMEVRDVRLG